MAIAGKNDPLKKQKDSLNFKNKTVERYNWPTYDQLSDDDMAKGQGRESYNREIKKMKKIGLRPGKGGMPYFPQTGTMVAPKPKKTKNPMGKK